MEFNETVGGQNGVGGGVWQPAGWVLVFGGGWGGEQTREWTEEKTKDKRRIKEDKRGERGGMDKTRDRWRKK